ncbi:hypothetical protein [Nocardia sp. NPDC057668]|uniref:hypothetical protein n=1 Tax=Nocardia sp. NPDC057668 TaxID=3346202 RepID=UPI00366B52D0
MRSAPRVADRIMPTLVIVVGVAVFAVFLVASLGILGLIVGPSHPDCARLPTEVGPCGIGEKFRVFSYLAVPIWLLTALCLLLLLSGIRLIRRR